MFQISAEIARKFRKTKHAVLYTFLSYVLQLFQFLNRKKYIVFPLLNILVLWLAEASEIDFFLLSFNAHV